MLIRVYDIFENIETAERDEIAARMQQQNDLLEEAEGRCEDMIQAKVELDMAMSELQEKLQVCIL